MDAGRGVQQPQVVQIVRLLHLTAQGGGVYASGGEGFPGECTREGRNGSFPNF